MSNFLEWGIREARKWNSPPHYYHGEYEHQPSVQEEAWIEAEIEKGLAQRLQEEAFIEEDEEVEAPKEASKVVIELECEKMVVEQKEQVVECEERKEVPIVDFVFGDKLIIDEEKPPSISTYLMNIWSTGIQGKKQAGKWNNFGSTWNRISEKFLNPLILYLIKLALMTDRCCNTMMELGQNLHDLKGLKNFAIDTG